MMEKGLLLRAGSVLVCAVLYPSLWCSGFAVRWLAAFEDVSWPLPRLACDVLHSRTADTVRAVFGMSPEKLMLTGVWRLGDLQWPAGRYGPSQRGIAGKRRYPPRQAMSCNAKLGMRCASGILTGCLIDLLLKVVLIKTRMYGHGLARSIHSLVWPTQPKAGHDCVSL